jgi:enamine deaminase RidA (YjgF/YER057c/UK114 family)
MDAASAVPYIPVHQQPLSNEEPMSRTVEKRLAELRLELPAAPAPVANYVPYVKTGNLAFISGQVCRVGNEMRYHGRLGEKYSVEEGQEAAKICALNMLAQLKEACGGDLDKVRRCVKLSVFVQSADGFDAQPQVANGASDLIVAVFGEKGKHARAAVGCNALPGGTAVEAEGVFEIEA